LNSPVRGQTYHGTPGIPEQFENLIRMYQFYDAHSSLSGAESGGTVNQSRGDVAIIDAFWNSLYSRWMGKGYTLNQPFPDATDVGAGVVKLYFQDFWNHALAVRTLASLSSAQPTNPLHELINRTLAKYVGRLQNLHDVISGHPITPGFRRLVDRFLPVMGDTDGLMHLVFPNPDPTISWNLADDTHVSAIVTNLESRSAALQSTDVKRKVAHAIRVLYGDLGAWPIQPPRVDPNTVAEYNQMSIRTDDPGGAYDGNWPALNKIGENIPIWAWSEPDEFAFTLFRTSFVAETDFGNVTTNSPKHYGIWNPSNRGTTFPVETGIAWGYIDNTGTPVMSVSGTSFSVAASAALGNNYPQMNLTYARESLSYAAWVTSSNIARLEAGPIEVNVPFSEMVANTQAWLEKEFFN
jgi:hypothetical protein